MASKGENGVKEYEMKERKKKNKKLWLIPVCLFGILAIAALVFMRFGGFSAGKSADPQEFAAYAGAVEDITIPEGARVIALGEATHGNAEFQQLKLDVFKVMVEKYGVRAFALEGDFGGCEQVNRYIHGGAGTAREAAAAIGFAIYRTQEMAGLIDYMRQYNDAAAPGEDLRFYGFDMQRYAYSFRFLLEACEAFGVDAGELEPLLDGEEWSDAFDHAARVERVSRVKAALERLEGSAQAVHLADMLLQNFELGGTDANYADLRDRFMAENVLWIAGQEAALGHARLFVSGHNGHVAKWGSYDAMGKLLSDELGAEYYVIGTDFYKTRCNMPVLSTQKRTKQVFYSHDPLANAAKKAGLDICWLDFAGVPEGSALKEQISAYVYMGTLGEGYAFYMRLLPPSYRIFQPPAVLYDSMIFVASAQPTRIEAEPDAR